MNLASLILQMALSIVSMVNTTPSIPQWQRDEALAIANKSILFAQATLAQSGYYNNNSNCAVYQSCGTYTPYNTYNPYTSYNPPVNYGAATISIINGSNVDTSFLMRNQTYTFNWSPFNAAGGTMTIQLLSGSGSIIFLGQTSINSFAWMPNAPSGAYQLQILQNSNVVASRSVTVQ